MKLELSYGVCALCASKGPTVHNLEPEVPLKTYEGEHVPSYWKAIDGRRTASPLCFSCVEAFDESNNDGGMYV